MAQWLAVSAAAFSLFLTACQHDEAVRPFQPQTKDYTRALPPGQLALRRIPPERYPDFSRGFSRREGLADAVQYSLEYLAKPSSRRHFPYGDIAHDRVVASLQHFLHVLREAQTPAEFDRMIRRDFAVFQSVGCDDRGTVFFTGYYCPIFEGRLQPDATFRYPVYALPSDLVKDAEGQTLGRRTADGRLVPYYTRREIEGQGVLRGHEIAWLRDAFEAYVVTVQGSAKLRLADGSLFELGYAGNNGHEYTSVGRLMVQQGVLAPSELSLQSMLRFFARNPQAVPRFCWKNDRTVFFQERSGGPFGSLNTPVTPFRSLATDKDVFPRACLTFVETKLPQRVDDRVAQRSAALFMLDQDTGGAIRAAGRGDIYMGIGPSAEALAGRTGSEGALYYLFVRERVGQAGS